MLHQQDRRLPAQPVEEAGQLPSSLPAPCRPSARRAGTPWAPCARATAISSRRPLAVGQRTQRPRSGRAPPARRAPASAMARFGQRVLSLASRSGRSAGSSPAAPARASITLRKRGETRAASEETWKLRASPMTRAPRRTRAGSDIRGRGSGCSPASGCERCRRSGGSACDLPAPFGTDQRVHLARAQVEARAIRSTFSAPKDLARFGKERGPAQPWRGLPGQERRAGRRVRKKTTVPRRNEAEEELPALRQAAQRDVRAGR
jgi:hypothetical protein